MRDTPGDIEEYEPAQYEQEQYDYSHSNHSVYSRCESSVHCGTP